MALRLPRGLPRLVPPVHGVRSSRFRRDSRTHPADRTRTLFYDVPGGGAAPDPGTPPKPPRPRSSPGAEKAVSEVAVREEAAPPEERPSLASLSDTDPEAVDVLRSLRRVDPRLVLSEREAVRLAPAVGAWLAAGVGRSQITSLLTAGLPDRLLARPAGILAFRLRETPLPAPPPLPLPPVAPRPPVRPLQTCEGGCERAIRAGGPDRCRDCRTAAATRAA